LPNAVITGFAPPRHDRFGLLAAVSRIAAILPNDIAPTNLNGPLPTLATGTSAAAQLHQIGHSCITQHFRDANNRNAGLCGPWSLG